MSIVRINALTVPAAAGDELEARFRRRLGEVEKMPGFESFELLRPDEGDTWYVYTRWESAEAFRGWVESEAFQRGHAQTRENPVAHASELLSFDVVLSASG
jgi:heme-degrading monooxygenase HmoA